MNFDNPGILALLVSFVVLIPFFFVRYRKSRLKAGLFASAAPSNERGSLLKELRFRMLLSEFFFMLFLGFLIVALAGPRWGIRKVNDYRRGVDLVLAFDLSRSMDVEDCHPPGQELISRLELGKMIALDLVLSLGDIRVGTAIGKGKGVLAVPLTYDSDTVMNFLYALDSYAITGAGTNLESIMDAAIGAFQDSIPSRRNILLFTDGENLSGSYYAVLEKAGKAGVTLSAVGLGSGQGGPVPVERGPDAPDGFLLAEDGNPLISSRQDFLLRDGAEKTGGIYVDGGLEDAAVTLAAYINSVYSDSRLYGQRLEEHPRWRIFVFAAIFCLGGARIMGYSRRSRNYFAVLLCLALFPSCARTQGQLLIMEANFLNTRGYYTEAISAYLRALNYDEAAPYAEYGLASAFFALEEGDAALDRYSAAERGLDSKAADHGELRYRIHYNRGIIYFEKGEYNEAALEFREALKIDGSRVEAKRNLELSLQTGARNRPPSQTGDGAGNGQDSAGTAALFEYLRAKGQEQWKSREWSGESESSGPDY